MSRLSALCTAVNDKNKEHKNFNKKCEDIVNLYGSAINACVCRKWDLLKMSLNAICTNTHCFVELEL